MDKSDWFPTICFVLIILVAGCSTSQENSPATTVPGGEPTWQFEQGIRTTGKIILSHPIELSFSIPGSVMELLIEEGDTIDQGDLIARLDTKLLRQEIASAEADLEIAKANLDRAMLGPSQAELIQAENDLIAAQAVRPLNMAQATIQVVDINSAQARLDYLKSLPLPEDVAMAQVEVERTKIKVDTARLRLLQADLVAPMSATVTKLFVNPYQYVGIGQPIVQLSDLTRLNVETEMNDNEVVGLMIGDVARVTFEALPGVEVKGVVVSIQPFDERQGGRNFVVVYELNEIPPGIRWGMSAEVYTPAE